MDVSFRNGKILHGDVLDRLKDIPDESVDVIISSPPYWGLRDYSVEGQLGLEPDFRDYLVTMRKIMSELKRVLKNTGTCWINYGDTYSTKPVGRFTHSEVLRNRDLSSHKSSGMLDKTTCGVKEKSRIGIPERFYINCIDDGWIARNHVPWYKSNSMPSSIKSRLTNKWESVFFFAKNNKTRLWRHKITNKWIDTKPVVNFWNADEWGITWEVGANGKKRSLWDGFDYYFELDAIREKTLTDSKPFNIRVRENISGRAQMKLGDQAWTATEAEMKKYNKDGTRKTKTDQLRETGMVRYPSGNFRNEKKQDSTLGVDGLPKKTYAGFNERWKNRKFQEDTQQGSMTERVQNSRDGGVDHEVGLSTVEDFDGIERFGTGKWQRHYDKDGNCLGCGKHWTKHTVSERAKGSMSEAIKRTEDIVWCNSKGKNPGDVFFINPKPFPEAHFATFPPALPEKILKCACPEGGTVLDPFFGSGTVGLVAEQLNKKWIGIELSAEYIEICKRRLSPYNSMRLDEFV